MIRMGLGEKTASRLGIQLVYIKLCTLMFIVSSAAAALVVSLLRRRNGIFDESEEERARRHAETEAESLNAATIP